ncbi:right-handed parallel beta-helix repeat-containing protein [Mesorhizobium sp. L2C066B000]|uniref:right-handed parallel beta-helix repeat-containing protein n=1 Tax=Mesorhizobium sp. L2C066B000 TaxID=1287105 RepID=UPI0003CF9F5D|nr:right-handed parallel beta-helix repeat-containing protein [Mesorhizobium sp. L2C066B000]ESZ40070.1 hypothetical protein X732_11725 [Mesorhizobium sp. L2C066B000]
MAATPYPLPRETRESAILVGNGTVGPYGPSLYKIFDTADVKVFAKLLGATVYSDVTANCTIAKVNPANAYDFFTVTFNAPVLASTSWYHQARRTAERSVAVTKAGTLVSNELEKELSKQASVESEVRRDLDRAYAAQPGSDPGFVIPGAAGDLMMSDASGNLVSSGENVTAIVGSTATAVAAAAAAATQAGIATTKAGEAAASAGILASLVAGFAALWTTVLQTATFAEAWMVLKLNGSLSTRALIKALVPQVGMSVLLTEAGRVGNFVWTLGDFTARIADDTQEGMFLKANSIAAGVGAWVRSFEILNVEMFGASLAASPAANKAAIQAAVIMAQKYVGELFFRELYGTDGPVTLSNTIKVYGRQAKQSGLSSSVGAAFSIVPDTGIANNNTWWDFRSLSIIATQAGHYGVEYASGGAEYLSNFTVDGVFASGPAGSMVFDSTGSTVGIFSCTLRRNWLNNGIVIKDGGDSIIIEENTINGTGIGILIQNLKTGARQCTIKNNNITTRSECVYLLNAHGTHIEENWMETPSYLGSYTGTTGALLFAQACDDLKITRNTIQPLDEVGGGFVGADWCMFLGTSGDRSVIDHNDLADGVLGHVKANGQTNLEIGSRGRLAAGETSMVLSIDATTKASIRNNWAVPRCKTTRSADQAGVVSATWTKVVLNVESQDVGGYFDEVTNNRWTPPKGRIAISAAMRFSAGLQDQQTYACSIYKNGVIYQVGAFFHSSGTAVIDPTIMMYDDASGTDYYELWCYGVSAGTLTIQGNVAFTWFEGQWLGPIA